MASLAIGLAGAAIGSGIGGTVLGISAASIGYAAGAMLGSLSGIDTMLFGEVSKGTRLNEFSLTVSTYGAALPVVYNGRIAGNVIWAGDVREVKHKNKTSTFFGLMSTTTSIEYWYYATFAVSLCEGPIISVDRIWADGAVIYDPDEGVNSINFTLYHGTADQLPDPTMQAKEGANNVPAYRGQAYVVIHDLFLGDFGNRVPNLNFEVTTGAGS